MIASVCDLSLNSERESATDVTVLSDLDGDTAGDVIMIVDVFTCMHV